MRRPLKLSSLFILAAALLAPSLAFAGPRPGNDAAGCKAAAQAFYTWYLHSAKEGWRDAIKLRKQAFEPTLLALLQHDAEQEDKTGDVGSFDFDPFLNSQDPYSRYLVKDPQIKDGICRIDVVGDSPDKKDSKPEVVAELAFQKRRWVFTNFHYGKDEWHSDLNLLAILKHP